MASAAASVQGASTREFLVVDIAAGRNVRLAMKLAQIAHMIPESICCSLSASKEECAKLANVIFAPHTILNYICRGVAVANALGVSWRGSHVLELVA